LGSILALPKELNVEAPGNLVEGIGYDFIPRVLDRSNIDYWMKSDDKPSFLMSRRLINEEGLLCGGSSGSAMYCALEYAKKMNLGADKRMVVILPDGVRNYMTKFLSKDWMIEKKFISLSEYDQEDHPLNGKSFESLGSKPIKYFGADLTVGQALDEFENGSHGIPIVVDGVVKSVIFENNLMKAMVNKKLKQDDLATKGKTVDFACVDSSVTLV
jgi:cystathionine beta-synthase